MDWFKHSSSMRFDPKVRKLIRRFGADGYAVYVYVLESVALGLSASSPLPVLEETGEDIAEALRVDSKKVEDIVRYAASLRLFGFIDGTESVVVPKMIDKLDENLRKTGKRSRIRVALEELQQAHAIGYDVQLGLPEPPVFEPGGPPALPPGSGSRLIGRLILAWNDTALPPCRHTPASLPNSRDVLDRIRVFGVEEIEKAIGFLGQYWEQIEPTYRPTSLDRFVSKSLEGWLEQARPWERFEENDDGSTGDEEFVERLKKQGAAQA